MSKGTTVYFGEIRKFGKIRLNLEGTHWSKQRALNTVAELKEEFPNKKIVYRIVPTSCKMFFALYWNEQ